MSCIYKIVNVLTGDLYIGSTNNYKKRIGEHKRKLDQNKHHSPKLQNAWNKYSGDFFEFHLITDCIVENKLMWEQIYFDIYKPKYNISKSSSAPMEGRKHSKKTITKLKDRKVQSGDEHYSRKQGFSLEHKEKIRQSRIGTKRSVATKQKMSETSKRLNRSSDLDKSRELRKKKIKDNFGNLFSSLTEAARFYNMSRQGICDILKGRTKKSKDGIVFTYYV